MINPTPREEPCQYDIPTSYTRSTVPRVIAALFLASSGISLFRRLLPPSLPPKRRMLQSPWRHFIHVIAKQNQIHVLLT
jgi:hypothetical protein